MTNNKNIPLLRNKFSLEQVNESYARLQSCRAVAKEFNCSHESVRTFLHEYGTGPKELIRHSCNENFFKVESEEVFYWAGFLAADGCVKRRGGTKELSLALSVVDKLHVDVFAKAIQTTAPIGIYIVKNSRKNSNHKDSQKAELNITSKIIFDDLAKFNIVPRKTFIYTFPEWLINHPLVHHFMRGYFDGDGSYYTALGKNKTVPQLFFNLLGTKEFLTTYRTILERECDITKRDKPVRSTVNIFALEYGGNILVKKITDYLYKDATIFLPRKREKILSTLNNADLIMNIDNYRGDTEELPKGKATLI